MAARLRPVDVDLTVISAKDLKNVNWRYGYLRPYAVAWVDPDNKVSTQVDREGDTKPLWNEKLTIPVTNSLQGAELTIDIVHEKASELTKHLIGTTRVRLTEILGEVGFYQRQERTLKLKRPSGRPQGKLEIAVCLREIRGPEQQYPYPQPYGTRDHTPSIYASAYYPSQRYPSAANPPLQQYPYSANPASLYSSGAYGDPYPQETLVSYRDSSVYSSGLPYGETHKPKSSKYGVGTGLAVGAVAGVFLALAEGIGYVDDKIVDYKFADDVAEKVEDDYADQGGYDDYNGGDEY